MTNGSIITNVLDVVTFYTDQHLQTVPQVPSMAASEVN